MSREIPDEQTLLIGANVCGSTALRATPEARRPAMATTRAPVASLVS
jgi:hypothetical protein